MYGLEHGVHTFTAATISPNSLLSLACLRLTLYNFEDVVKGFTIGHNLVGDCQMDMSWVIAAGYAVNKKAWGS
jgi:hypothetical protein